MPPTSPHLCLDFGTGYCKAAVCAPGQVPRPLAIGEAVRHRGDAHMVRTALCISHRGNVFFGEAAVDTAEGEGRAPFVSLKETFISARNASEIEEPLPAEHNPTAQPVTKRQAITLFLAFLSQAALRGHPGGGRNVVRSIAMPVFAAPKAAWVSKVLADGLGHAQLLADRFGDRLFASVSLADALAALNVGGESQVTAEPPTVAEPVAAVAGHLLHVHPQEPPRGAPGLMLVVDVGAGTSDIAMFAKGEAGGVVTFRHVARSMRSIAKAGRAIDQALVSHLVAKSGRTGADQERLTAELLRERRGELIKDELFTRQQVTRAGTGTSLKAFLDSGPLRTVAGEILGGVDAMLRRVDPSFFKRQVAVRLSGGGASLPFLGKLTGQRHVGKDGERKTQIDLVRTDSNPHWHTDPRFADLRRQVGPKFHRLAVALGGAYYGAEARSWLRLEEDIEQLGAA